MRDTVLNVLSETATRKIDFRLRGLHFDKSDYERIHARVVSGRIAVVTRESRNRIAAQYDPSCNVLYVDPSKDYTQAKNKSLIVHEATHAVVDMAQATATTRWSDECAAYIAQMLYLVFAGVEFGDAIENLIHSKALYVIAQNNLFRAPGSQADIGLSDLRNHIFNVYNNSCGNELCGYRKHEMTGANGIENPESIETQISSQPAE